MTLTMTSLLHRPLGASGIEVSPIGLGCWAIGGHFLLDGRPDSYGAVDDTESIRAIRGAITAGVSLIDTADAYGTGHSEEVVGRAVAGRRDQVVLATKFGYVIDPEARTITGTDASGGYVRRALAASLRRLRTDYIDLYQLHLGDATTGQAEDAFATLEDLRQEGLIRAYGWSTWEADAVRHAARRWRLASVQHELNVLVDQPDLRAVAAEAGIATIANMPLAMGLLSGRYGAATRMPADEVRGSGHSWVRYFSDGRPDPDFLAALAAVREILTGGGRSLVQGALAWVLAQGPMTVAIPGFKSPRQALENAGTLQRPPLTAAELAEIDVLLGRAASG